jgi:hypothetical protein
VAWRSFEGVGRSTRPSQGRNTGSNPVASAKFPPVRNEAGIKIQPARSKRQDRSGMNSISSYKIAVAVARPLIIHEYGVGSSISEEPQQYETARLEREGR